MKIFKFLYWKFVDVSRVLIKIIKKEPLKIHLYGIYGYFGLPGKGKTMALVHRLEEIRTKYGSKVYIMTNFHYKNQDFIFEKWEQLLDDYDKPLVVAWDEVQNEFTSRNFKNFPIELLTLLTQNRKGNGKMILYTAQRWSRVDKIFRELTFTCGECKTLMGRWTRVKHYDWEDYDMLNSTVDVNTRIKIRAKYKTSFIQTDYIRELYDSYKMLSTARSKEYMSRDELKSINGG